MYEAYATLFDSTGFHFPTDRLSAASPSALVELALEVAREEYPNRHFVRIQLDLAIPQVRFAVKKVS